MEEDSIMKIGIVGLANAGKTSLTRTLQRNYSIGNFDSLKPTRNVERSGFSLFGTQGTIWDYGGQKQYRENYLSKPERFLSEIRYLFYVIDMQDTANFPDTLEYFSLVYQNVKNLSKELIITIIFNKVDPGLDEGTYKGHIDSLSKEIRKMAETSDILFCNTSIYDPYSVLAAFSRAILGDTELFNAVSVLFANYALTKNVEYISLVVDNLLEAGSFKIKNLKQDFISASMKFYRQFSDLEIDQAIRTYEFEDYRFIIVKGTIDMYEYTLNIAHPIEVEDPENVPQEADIRALLKEIDGTFVKFKPSFY
jgi:Ras-related GTP-binding protein A/B